MFRTKFVLPALAAAGLALGSAAAAAAAPAPSPLCAEGSTTTCVLDLELNDPVGSTAAVDSSGRGHDGQVGNHVKFLTDAAGSFARWDRHAPGAGIFYGYDHLISVPDASDGSLDPGTGDFSVEIRYRTKENFGNVLQKGQTRTVGGQVKIQQPGGKITCMFRTPTGTATAGSGTTLLNDNTFHTVRCDRTPTQVTMYIDGVKKSTSNHATGNLDNAKPWTLGGKLECDQEAGSGADSCDYYAGDIDYVRISKGDAPPTDTVAPAVTATSPAAEAVGVRRGSNVTATFNEPVTGVSGTTMVLRKASSGVQYTGAVSYDPTSQTATLNPDLNLPSNARFSVTLTSGVTDTAGNALTATSWSFTTGS
jgi:hypothetical protein